MTRVGTQIVLDALLIADINHDTLEDTCGRAITDRNRQAALQHILQQANRFQAYRFTTSIRTTDKQQSLCTVQHNIQRHHMPTLLLQRELQQGMDGTNPVDNRFGLYGWFKSLSQLSPLGLGLNQVDHSQQLIRVDYLAHVRAYLISKYGKYAYHLAALFGLQLAHLVVCLNHLGWLNKHRLTSSTLIVHNTVNTALYLWSHWYHQSSVAHSGGSILIYQPIALGRMQYSI